jgi:hypothetical protein
MSISDGVFVLFIYAIICLPSLLIWNFLKKGNGFFSKVFFYAAFIIVAISFIFVTFLWVKSPTEYIPAREGFNESSQWPFRVVFLIVTAFITLPGVWGCTLVSYLIEKFYYRRKNILPSQ